MMILLAFLGNPGLRYAHTRHNYGWMVAEQFQTRFPGMSYRNKFNAELSSPAVIHGEKVVTLRPQQYMNNSGRSIAAAARFFSVEPSHILVVHDDMELPFGSVAFRQEGGLHSHNGLRSIAGSIGTKVFPRIALGIGRPQGTAVQSHVLGRFGPVEEHQLPTCIREALDLIESVIRKGPAKAEPVSRTLFN